MNMQGPIAVDAELSRDSPLRVAVVVVFLGLAMAIIGGWLCGLMIDRFGVAGSISLWALGFICGFVAAKLSTASSRVLTSSLITACVVAFVFAEVCWIHWNIKDAETWLAAMAKFPLFLKEFQLDAFIAGIFTLFGCQAIYRQTAMRS